MVRLKRMLKKAIFYVNFFLLPLIFYISGASAKATELGIPWGNLYEHEYFSEYFWCFPLFITLFPAVYQFTSTNDNQKKGYMKPFLYTWATVISWLLTGFFGLLLIAQVAVMPSSPSLSWFVKQFFPYLRIFFTGAFLPITTMGALTVLLASIHVVLALLFWGILFLIPYISLHISRTFEVKVRQALARERSDKHLRTPVSAKEESKIIIEEIERTLKACKGEGPFFRLQELTEEDIAQKLLQDETSLDAWVNDLELAYATKDFNMQNKLLSAWIAAKKKLETEVKNPARKINKNLQRKIEELTFRCRRCKAMVKPQPSKTCTEYKNGLIDRREALRRFKLSHYRHKHVNYEETLEKFKNALGIDIPDPLLKNILKDIAHKNLAKAKFRIFNMLEAEQGNRLSKSKLLQITNEKIKKIFDFSQKRDELKRKANEIAQKLILQDELVN